MKKEKHPKPVRPIKGRPLDQVEIDRALAFVAECLKCGPTRYSFDVMFQFADGNTVRRWTRDDQLHLPIAKRQAVR